MFIALYENATPFAFRSLGPDTPEHTAEWLRRWPLRKFPLLVEGERDVVETSIIIEYLQLAHPGPVRLLPTDPMAALDCALKRVPAKNEEGLVIAAERLERANAWLEGRLAGRTWAAGGLHAGGLRRRLRCSMRTGSAGPGLKRRRNL